MFRMLSYYGSKVSLAKKYPEPIYNTIVEPFAGGAGYSLSYPDRQVILVEKNPVVAGALKWIIKNGSDGVMRLPILSSDQTVDDFDLDADAKAVIGFWVNSAVASPCRQLSKWAKERIGAICFWGEKCRERLAKTADAVKHWQVINGEYTEAPNIAATWFIDPPYEGQGVHYPCGSKGINYNALGVWCRSRTGQIIVCENVGATWLPFTPCGFGVSAQHQRKAKQEAMWYRIQE
jgi:hypothetical protein